MGNIFAFHFHNSKQIFLKAFFPVKIFAYLAYQSDLGDSRVKGPHCFVANMVQFE